MHKKIPDTLVVIVVGGLLVALGCWLYFGDTAWRQKRRMNHARQFVPGISNAVHSRSEFSDVTVGVGTADGGCFLLFGSVETITNLAELKRIVAAQHPSVAVRYAVHVLEEYSASMR
jgi:hypothetical protein